MSRSTNTLPDGTEIKGHACKGAIPTHGLNPLTISHLATMANKFAQGLALDGLNAYKASVNAKMSDVALQELAIRSITDVTVRNERQASNGGSFAIETWANIGFMRTGPSGSFTELCTSPVQADITFSGGGASRVDSAVTVVLKVQDVNGTGQWHHLTEQDGAYIAPCGCTMNSGGKGLRGYVGQGWNLTTGEPNKAELSAISNAYARLGVVPDATNLRAVRLAVMTINYLNNVRRAIMGTDLTVAKSVCSYQESHDAFNCINW
jgi:hypothetical protein